MKHFVGIDPGFSGAVGSISEDGSDVWVCDMPVKMRGKTKKYKVLDCRRLYDVLQASGMFCGVVGLEDPTTRPGEGAERAARFGRQLGMLEMALTLAGADFELIAPALWKGRLGLAGKETDRRSEQGHELFKRFYPDHEALLYGPRGGLKDGRLDALLIAHWLRTRTLGGMQAIADKFGKDSPEAMALVLGGGKKKRRK